MGAERFDPYPFSQLSGNSNRLKKEPQRDIAAACERARHLPKMISGA